MRRQIRLGGLSRLLVLSSFLVFLVAFAVPTWSTATHTLAPLTPPTKVSWSQSQITLALSPGTAATLDISCVTEATLDNIRIEPVPALARLLTVQPAGPFDLRAGIPKQLLLSFAIPAGARFGTIYEGTIHVRQGSRTIPELLKVSITVVRVPSSAELQATVALHTQLSDYFDTARRRDGDLQARAELLRLIRQQPEVLATGITPDGESVGIIYLSGIEGVISGTPVGSLGAAKNKNLSRARNGVFSSLVGVSPPAALQSVVASPDSVSVLVLAPFYDDPRVGPWDPADSVAENLSDTCAGGLHPITNENVTVDLMKSMNQYGTILITTHGAITLSGQVAISTGESVSSAYTSHLGDLLQGRLVLFNDTLAINPAFVRRYAGFGFPRSIVYIGACLSFGTSSVPNLSMVTALLDSGAAVVYGWKDSVFAPFNGEIARSVVDTLSDSQLGPQSRTATQAFSRLPSRIDPTPDPITGRHAEFMISIQADMALCINPPAIVVDGDASDWTGISPIIQDERKGSQFFGFDILSARVTNDTSNVYFLVEFDLSFPSVFGGPLGFLVFLDTDLNIGTGCFGLNFGDATNNPMGTEGIITYSDRGYLQELTNCGNPPDRRLAVLQVQAAGPYVELAVPLSTLQQLTPTITGFDLLVVSGDDATNKARYILK